MSQMVPDARTEPICVICGISAICVRFWSNRDAWPLYRDNSRFLDSALRAPLGMTCCLDLERAPLVWQSGRHDSHVRPLASDASARYGGDGARVGAARALLSTTGDR